MDREFGIGKDRTLPWRLKKEMQHFTSVTTTRTDPEKQHMVVMGRTTWESLPVKFRPLPDRKNVVLTRDDAYDASGATVATSLEQAFDAADGSIEDIFVIGGGYVYRESIVHPDIDGLYLTVIDHDFECDTFFPDIPPEFSIKKKLGQDTEKDVMFTYYLYTKS